MVDRQHKSEIKLLEAALFVVRAKGYTATRVEDICAAAGVTNARTRSDDTRIARRLIAVDPTRSQDSISVRIAGSPVGR